MTDAPVTPTELTAAIVAVRDRLVADGRYDGFAAINAGYCGDFADDVQDFLGRSPVCAEPYQVGVEGFMESEDDEPTVMDRALLAEHWPDVVPPQGLDWDDVDALAARASFSCGTHTWLCLAGRHYDAEAPDGVDNFFDLPFFSRIVASWVEDSAPQPR